MVFLPYSSDAPLYHYPITTIGTVVVNVSVFCYLAMSFDYDQAIAPYILEYGNGYHPLQWVTSNFIHGNLIHLLGNMVFLLVFGTIVEGKIGWWKTLLLILGIGVAQNIIEQTLALSTTGIHGSYGASGFIFGLMAICLIWAPMNNVQCAFFILFRMFEVEMAVLHLVGIYVLMEITSVTFWGGWTSAFLHLLGAGAGAAIGLFMLKNNMVDCEKWDVFSVIAGREGGRTDSFEPDTSIEEQLKKSQAAEIRNESATALEHIDSLLEQGQALAAQKVHQRMQDLSSEWRLPEQTSLRLIETLSSQQRWSDVVTALARHIQHFPAASDILRISLAEILLTKQQRPRQALEVLSKMNTALLDPDLGKQVETLTDAASKSDAPYEVVERDW